MDRKFDVLVAGELNVDIIMNDMGAMAEVGKEVIARKLDIVLGSSSAIFASNLSTLGSDVAFAGMIGHDTFGDLVLQSLQLKNVDTQGIVISNELKTGATVVLNFDQDRANVTYPGAMSHFGVSDIPAALLQRTRHLHVGSVFLQERLLPDLEALLAGAKKLGVTTSVDPQWDPTERWDMGSETVMNYIDVFMPNMEELLRITKSVDSEEAFRKVKESGTTTVIKCGAGGAYLWNGESLIHQPAYLNNSVVDSIGAGDSFDAGFIHAYLLGRSWKDCLELGAVMGALNTTAAGGTAAFKDFDNIKSTARSVFNYNF